MKIARELLIIATLIISPPTYSEKGEVCFYELDDFRGESFCSNEGEIKSTYHDGFNNKIESISVPPGMVVTLYDDIDLSGNKLKLKNDINLPGLKKSGFYNKVNSYKIAPAICFYTEDEFQGSSTCLASNQQIDFYHDTEAIIESDRQALPIYNDSIQSITIPPGMIATIYKDDNFRSPFFKLTESITDNNLKALEMSDAITGIKVSKIKGLNCDQQCVIVNSHKIKLADVFGEYWNDERLKNKQVLLVFNSQDIGENDIYDIKFFSSPAISINKRFITFSDHRMVDKFYFERYRKNDNLSFIIQIQEDSVEVQYIQTLNHDLVDVSPIISFERDTEITTPQEITITNYNKNNPLVLAKSILTADTGEQDWEKRDLTQTSKIICAFTPFLNIYNYLIQGKCQQLDGLVFSADSFFNSNTKGKTLHIAGNSSPLKPKSAPKAEPQIPERIDNHMTLTYIDNNKHRHSLSLPAVAKTCMVPLHSLLNSRPIRQIRPQCIDWTLEIMTDFTFLFGHSLETWNTAFFGRVIDSIVRTGSTGTVVEDQEVENRLIQAVKEKVTDRTTNNALADIKTAFDYAQLGYLSYSFYSSSDEPPARVERLPLGIYELLLENFIYTHTTPIIISQGLPVEQPDLEFEIEILPTLTYMEEAKLSDAEVRDAKAMRRKLNETMTHWEHQYEQGYPAQGTSASAGTSADAMTDENSDALTRLLNAGNIVTGIIKRRLRLHRAGEVYVVVKLQGRIIAIILADRFNREDEVELVASATQPDFVLHPDREGTVRGAGTAAVRALGRYLQQQGAKTLYSEVISQPSARVKQKVGFNFKGEF
ncbi:peptidase inhibitor family I36 protein [Yersinia enterocolitica]|uniref:peptidase inhibitor family I36 protein n=1 Tax=Yersinia enterocolitica TaxID=630 RepID=UPI0005DADA68|nr:peptidase inhibitor family I36 protein [Yersinia enterocolitica]EKN3383553.1 GNAT family N-acetyltransferase [Yersinia enterocolitica]EKN3439791.1 GNAT family N-acetyltransferase [Yersinia enterocolitica]EKN3458873.1 GNAT family N-acetyltransferase [Yersinia enterocolitica]EKN3503575.1 GNAT family N-acetyltransferase [Yersinia enterocolitica]EKN3565089.1 GNAT family N-acetyltransferase [Yersinia enterocolitica]